jgi:thiosulfate/3-mercaptopyruvate sulfurtransferase
MPVKERDMPSRTVVPVFIITLILAASAASGQSAAPLLVDADWLSQHLGDRDLVVLHVGDDGEYRREHIPGARLITEEDVSRPHNHSNLKDMMLELPDVATLRARVSEFGVSDTSRVVVYFGKDGPVQSATRIIFTLDYLGLGARSSLLNGGLAEWKRAGKPVTGVAPPAARGKLAAPTHENLVVDAAFVSSVSSRPGYKLIDARAPVFYKGVEPTMNGKAGHIRGAINFPFTDVTDAKMMFDRDRLAGVFERAGVKPGDTIVAYCHVGQQATAVLFAARLLGHPVMLYDGAFQDWAVNDRGPVEK